MDYPKHNPQDIEYRCPVGAIPTETKLTLNIDVPSQYEVCEAYLQISFNDTNFDMPMSRQSCGEYDRFTATYFADESRTGPMFYCFRLRRDGGEPYWYGKMLPTIENPHITGGIYNEIPPMWQVTVYDKSFTVPKWYGEGITYQIFPDRFSRSHLPRKHGCKAERVVHEDWYDLPEYKPLYDNFLPNNDFYGGNIRGIIDKLDYLSNLGVRTIYLNPIFEAASNHRYDTANYENIDPMFGTEKQFVSLCEKAKKRGIRIILDGVFSHTGADSIYFNKFGNYDCVGAYQSNESQYYPWYTFTEYPDKYESWWGISILPAVKEMEPSYLDYIVTGCESIVRKWIRLGASGWRLDVADELPDEFIRKLRQAVKEENPDAVIIGEVWEDASNKVAYSKTREYFGGFELDGVMNYPLRDAILSYLRGGDALAFRTAMESIVSNYPTQVLNSLMNIVGTHDTVRILTSLGFMGDAHSLGRDGRAVYRLNDTERQRGKALLRLATAIQFSFPGSPTIYYGDEAGMEGFEDPFCRMCYPWGREDWEILSWYQRICNVYNESDALRSGTIKFIYALGDVLAYKRQTETETVTVIINRGAENRKIPFSLHGVDLLTGKEIGDCLDSMQAAFVKG